MASTKALKQRIKSVKNTSQITKAMEVVSATKMRKSQEFAIRARPYAIASLEMMQNLLSRTSALPKVLQNREIKNTALLVVTSDKGLAGAFNTNVLRRTEAWVKEASVKKIPFVAITVGKKAKDFCERKGIRLEKSFISFGDYSKIEDTTPVAEILIKGFLYEAWDEVNAIYTNFRTTLKQETVLRKILPVDAREISTIVTSILPEKGKYAEESKTTNHESKYNYEYKFEPSPVEILETLVPQLIRMHIHHIILESNASEHSARMVAMKSASDNAKELIGELTLEFNKSRQAQITRELTEITAGKEALEN